MTRIIVTSLYWSTREQGKQWQGSQPLRHLEVYLYRVKLFFYSIANLVHGLSARCQSQAMILVRSLIRDRQIRELFRSRSDRQAEPTELRKPAGQSGGSSNNSQFRNTI